MIYILSIVFYIFFLHIDIYVNIYSTCFVVNEGNPNLRNNIINDDELKGKAYNNTIDANNQNIEYNKNLEHNVNSSHISKFSDIMDQEDKGDNENSHDIKFEEKKNINKSLDAESNYGINEISITGNDSNSDNSNQNIFPDGSELAGGIPRSIYTINLGFNKCPTEEICKDFSNLPQCRKNVHERNNWLGSSVKNFSSDNKGVLVPPRRQSLCLRITLQDFRTKKKKEGDFEKFIYSYASSEAKKLRTIHNNISEKALQAIKYSFADIGNIIKGDDLLDTPTSNNTKTYLEEVLKLHNKNNETKDAKKWWTENRYHVWEAMMCGYQNEKKDNECTVYGNIDDIPQFLRWFREWGTYVCEESENNMKTLKAVCFPKQLRTETNSAMTVTQKGTCSSTLKNYEEWYNKRKNDI